MASTRTSRKSGSRSTARTTSRTTGRRASTTRKSASTTGRASTSGKSGSTSRRTAGVSKSRAVSGSTARKRSATRAFSSGKTRSSSREPLVVASKVKAYINRSGFNTSSDALAGLTDRVYSMLDEAMRRTSGNGRKTVKLQDI